MELPSVRIVSVIVTVAFLGAWPAPAQVLPSTPPDSLLSTIPSLQDTARVAGPGASGVDTVVVYSASDSIIYSMRTRYMNLYGKSDLKYRTIGLKAERVDVNWNTATLTAQGVRDTSDTTGTKTIGSPVLVDGGETYNGHRIGYNFRTQKGKITVGDTEIEQGYYHGEAIKKVEKDVLYVAGGRYTTCDAEHPHYYFYSPKMKVILRDHIVAEPVYFYIADVPVFALPFGVFPNRSGRRSGIIAPAYGEDARRGRFLSHFGYYWAISDYMDLATTFDWYTRGGGLNRSLFRYALRYNFTGSVSANVTSLRTGEPGDPGRTEQRDYNIQLTHNQQIDPTTRLDANFTFASGSYFRNVSSNLNEILRQNIISNATLSKTWQESNRNLTINIYRDQNLVTDDVEERLPSISFSQGQFFPFRRSSPARASGTDPMSEYSWYEMIGISYNAQGQYNRSKRFEIIKSKVTPQVDSLKKENRNERGGVNHQVSISASPKAGYLTISPFLSYNEKWYGKSIERDTLGEREVSGFQAVRTFSTGLSASTRFFGIFQPQVFGITSIRHTVTPNLTFSYQPDFSDPRFGYYGRYIDRSGKEVVYNRYEREIYGGAPRGRQQSLGLSVGNLFEMKYLSSDTAQQEKKIQLMNIGANISYNFVADSLRLSPLSLSYRTDIGNVLNISASTTHDFYMFDPAAGARVNRFVWSNKQIFPDLTSVSLSLSTSLSAPKKETTTKGPASRTAELPQEQQPGQIGQPAQMRSYTGLFEEETPDFSIPWNLTLGYTFTQSQHDPRRKIRSSSINASLSFNLTENWRFSTSGSYDFIRKEFAAPSVNIYRDLHCWEMNITWFPMGFYRGYRLEIRVKAPQLQDLKITKQGSERGTYY